MTVHGDADWLAILRKETGLLEDGIEVFQSFNPNGENAFWHLIVLAFRAVEYDKENERPRFQRQRDTLRGLVDSKKSARRKLRATIINIATNKPGGPLHKATKETGKAITAIKRGRPGQAEKYTGNALQALGEMATTHEAARFLKTPFTVKRLTAAKLILEAQSTRIKNIPKISPPPPPRNNQREHALFAIKYLACAYRISHDSLHIKTWTTGTDEKSGFTGLLAAFHRTAPESRLRQHSLDAFLRLATDRRQDIEAFVASHPPIDDLLPSPGKMTTYY